MSDEVQGESTVRFYGQVTWKRAIYTQKGKYQKKLKKQAGKVNSWTEQKNLSQLVLTGTVHEESRGKLFRTVLNRCKLLRYFPSQETILKIIVWDQCNGLVGVTFATKPEDQRSVLQLIWQKERINFQMLSFDPNMSHVSHCALSIHSTHALKNVYNSLICKEDRTVTVWM